MNNKNYYNPEEVISSNEKTTITIIAVILGLLVLTTLYFTVRG